MYQSGDSDILVSRLESLLHKNLSEEEKHEITIWDKGRTLSQIANHPGWQVILEMLQNYVNDAARRLMNTDPGAKEDVVAEHAILYASNRIITSFIEDANAAIEAAKKTPSVVKEGLRGISEVPPESI